MIKQTKMIKFRLASWNKLRKAFYGRMNETFSEYIERIAIKIEKDKKLLKEYLEDGY